MNLIKEDANFHEVKINNKLVRFTYLGNRDMPPFSRVTSVSAIPFTEDGKLMVVRLRQRGIDLPGGHVEKGETSPETTLNREVMEELCVTIRSLKLVEVIQSDFFDEPSFMLVYAAHVDNVFEFKASKEASERIITRPRQFIEQYTAGNKDLMKSTILEAWRLMAVKN